MDNTPAKTIIKEILLDYKNIKKYYDPKKDDEYPHQLFNNDEEVLINNYMIFVKCLKECNENPHAHLFKMLPTVFEYATCVGLGDHYVIEWLDDDCSYHYIFGTYAVAFAEEIMGEYDEYITNLYFTPREIAISKLKRNRIVNEGVLLKLSMKNCGMF